jgi:hypothetical protein
VLFIRRRRRGFSIDANTAVAAYPIRPVRLQRSTFGIASLLELDSASRARSKTEIYRERRAHHDPDETIATLASIADADRIEEDTVGGAKISLGVLGNFMMVSATPRAADSAIYPGRASDCP